MKSSCVACFNSECRFYSQRSLLLPSHSGSVLSLVMSYWRGEAAGPPLVAGLVGKTFSVLSLPTPPPALPLFAHLAVALFYCPRHTMKFPTRPPSPWPNSCPFTKSEPLPQARLTQPLLMVSCWAGSYAFQAQVLLCCELLTFLMIYASSDFSLVLSITLLTN